MPLLPYLGMSYMSLLLGTQNHNHASAFQLWLALNNKLFSNHCSKVVHYLISQFPMSHFTPTKSYGHLYLVTGFQELGGILCLYTHIVFLNGCRQSNLFHIDSSLVLTGSLFFFGQFKPIFPVI